MVGQFDDFLVFGREQNVSATRYLGLKDFVSLIDSIEKDHHLETIKRTRPWEYYNWPRAAFITSLIEKANDSKTHYPPLPPLESLEAIMLRRSRRFFVREPMQENDARQIRDFASSLLLIRPWLNIFVVNCAVREESGQVWHLHQGNSKNLSRKIDLAQLRDCLHGMWWIPGSGMCLFFMVDLPMAARAFPQPVRGYFSALVDTGRVAQAVLAHICARGLGGWMTPAIQETKVKKILKLEGDELEPIYFLRLGEPDNRVWDYEK